MPWVPSLRATTEAGSAGLSKLGQPQPESNLSLELNSSRPSTTST